MIQVICVLSTKKLLMIPYSYPQEKRNSDVTNLLRFLVFEKAGWYVALLGERIGITPNGMSFLSCIPALVALYLNMQSHYMIAVLLMAVYYLLDNADGHLARMTKKTSPFGSYLDDALGLIIWPFYWGSFIFSVNTPLLLATVVVLSFTAEGRSLFGYKFTEKKTKSKNEDKSHEEVQLRIKSPWKPLNLFFQVTNVGGLFFLLFPLLLWFQLDAALLVYGTLFLLRYFLLALNYGFKLWKR